MREDLIKTASKIVIFFVILFIYSKLAGPIPFSINSVNTTKSTTFDVTGEGKVNVKPDLGTVSAGVSATGATTSQVQNEINSSINKVSEAVRALGVDSKDIQTSTYNINPTYSDSQVITGYSANTTLTIKVRDINKVGQVIDAATRAGATNVNNLGFEVSDKSKLENEARKLAVDDAKKKAQNEADIAGFRLGRIVNYSESFGGQPRPMPLAAESAIKTPTNLQTGQEEIDVTVTLSYEID